GPVAGEHPPGPVRAVRRRREPEQYHARGRVAEPGDRAAPVVPVAERRALLPCHLLAPRDEPRAAAALDDLALELSELAHVLSPAASSPRIRRSTTGSSSRMSPGT